MGTPLWWADEGDGAGGVPSPAGGPTAQPLKIFEITYASRRVLVYLESMK
jgi:hypothetical protein